MKICLFTGNKPHHTAMALALMNAGYEVMAIINPKPAVMDHPYWRRMRDAEWDIFSLSSTFYCPVMVSFETSWLLHAFDRAVVFSGPFLTGDFFRDLPPALNLHAGIAPEYRGSACNFWAEYDKHPELVGAQVQRLGQRLDGGEILAEVVATDDDPFMRGMHAVQLGIKAMVKQLEISPDQWKPIRPNDPAQTIRYSR